ncbi:MAG TPA: DNA methyltransferase [Paludibacteraceae bacterium]|nr:DNA methyltransferase [Paludibacteraceae bacterium]
MEWKTVKKRLSELKPLENNPRKISNENLERLGRDMENLGNFRPLVCDVDGTVLAGNQRYKKLLEKYGQAHEVEVSVPEKPLTEKQRKEVVILDNKHRGEDDIDMLMKDYSDTLESLGFDDLIPEPEIEVKEDNYEEPEDLQTTVVLGDVYQLGDHRLMCGDSTKVDDVEKLMNGEKADMVFTDPPYGMNLDTDYSSMKSEIFKGGIGGNKYDAGIVDNFDPEMINTIMLLKARETFIWGADYFAELLPNKNDGSWVVWDKRANGNDDIEQDKSSDKMYGSCFELCWSKNKHKRDIARVKWAGIFGMSSQDQNKRIHPTQKPLELCCWFLKRYSKTRENIVDLFGGSGSTLIACEQTNRKCYMMELDPYYCSVIINRWETYTGKGAVKI